jgi:tetrapyrrole methylase family protein/MazG family protein
LKPKITVVGLGFGNEDSLTLSTWKLLTSGQPLFLRTKDHPITPWLLDQNITYTTFDEIYTQYDTFAPVYEAIVSQLFSFADQHGAIIYAVPGHPMVAERTVQLLLQQQGKYDIDVRGGGSFLDIAFARLAIDPVEGFQLLDGTSLTDDLLHPRQHVLIGQVYSQLVASDVKLTLMNVYPDEYEVIIADHLGVEGKEQIKKVPLYELDRQSLFGNLTTVYVPPATTEEIYYRQFTYLLQTMRMLRSPDGCPWDQKQTHESLRPYLIEEAYEFIDAINEQDDAAMVEELGDVLLQVIFHGVIAEQRAGFTLSDVIETLNAKLIRRHPHVFGSEQAHTPEEVVQTWDAVKKQEGKEKQVSLLDNIPKSFPVMRTALEQQKKAAKVGFDWNDVAGAVTKLHEELGEFAEAPNEVEREKELGDVLFSMINVARLYKLDPEVALARTVQKFRRRFRYLEQQANAAGRSLEGYDIDQLEIWWQAAKQREGESDEIR